MSHLSCPKCWQRSSSLSPAVPAAAACGTRLRPHQSLVLGPCQHSFAAAGEENEDPCSRGTFCSSCGCAIGFGIDCGTCGVLGHAGSGTCSHANRFGCDYAGVAFADCGSDCACSTFEFFESWTVSVIGSASLTARAADDSCVCVWSMATSFCFCGGAVNGCGCGIPSWSSASWMSRTSHRRH